MTYFDREVRPVQVPASMIRTKRETLCKIETRTQAESEKVTGIKVGREREEERETNTGTKTGETIACEIETGPGKGTDTDDAADPGLDTVSTERMDVKPGKQ